MVAARRLPIDQYPLPARDARLTGLARQSWLVEG